MTAPVFTVRVLTADALKTLATVAHSNNHLVWFRSDLRVGDNPALHHAIESADRLVAMYIHTPQQDQQYRGPRQQAFIKANLQFLASRLEQLGIELEVAQCARYAKVPDQIVKTVKKHRITQVFANREPGINEERRDHDVARKIGLPFKRFNGDCVLKYGSVVNGKGDMFRVFTPFRNAWLKTLGQQGYSCLPPLTEPETETAAKRDAFLQWPAGEAEAQLRLQRFIENGVQDYAQQRDLPGAIGTSGVSPYLAVGVLSPRQCLQALHNQFGFLPMSPGETGFAWLNELVWREFYRHLMVAYPKLSMDRCFKPEMDALRWLDDETAFQAWCDGMTGYPIVDAAMRCLKQTGWMHNRLRMVVASFLTKDLQIDWRRGERYFMQQLIDADFASNNGGWQWAAGTGADAAPYFRIFNPTSQGKKFDPDGAFILRWLPELKPVPTKLLHTPQTWLDENRPDHGYPRPIVDHAEARRQTLDRYQQLKENS